jgi:LemA protein
MSTTALIILGLIGLTILLTIIIYNNLVSLRNRFKNSFAQIDVQLQRRYDLIPNLVETAKGYMKHERDTLEAVIRARNEASQARQIAAQHPENSQSMLSLSGAESALTGTLGRFFALSESYPDIKANQTMQKLMEELTSTENKVSFARQAFNDAVMTYNTACETFPNNFIANFFKFQTAELFNVVSPEIKQSIKVQF